MKKERNHRILRGKAFDKNEKGEVRWGTDWRLLLWVPFYVVVLCSKILKYSLLDGAL